ncbi:NADPH-dependent FMN reductase [Staphylospora marina]|uniref:NADPH-dependent FMN reductase n=1 Tax=Staphylospora marina TaxID=2490858 RepID=UPI000F5BA2C2|nr:NAD(P)H-dependent oxidoreductase [Staphylospora marina]
MKILVIGGSPRANGKTRVVAEAGKDLLKAKGIEVLEFDVRNHALPLYDGDEETANHPQVKRLVELAGEADGFLICSPEYHSGMSGALKNALDFLSGKQFRRKPAAIVAVAGGGKGGINALNNMRTVLRGVGALVIPDQLVIDEDRIQGNLIVDETLQRRYTDLVEQLAEITSALRAANAYK